MRRLNAFKAEDARVKTAGEADAFWPEEGSDSKTSSTGLAPSTAAGNEVKKENATDSESETEEEEDEKDGGLVIRLDDSSGDESETANSASSSLSTSSTKEPRVKEEEEEHSTFASRESEKQRIDRSRLYRQHELRQGGKIRSTDEDWRDFCSISNGPNARSGIENAAMSAGKRVQNTIADAIEVLSSDDEEDRKAAPTRHTARSLPGRALPAEEQEWSCQVCTLRNPGQALRCDACLTTRGSSLVGQ